MSRQRPRHGLMDIREQFGRIVKELRVTKSLSQEELAHRARMNVTYLSDLENGKSSPSLVMIVDLARALDVHPADLVAGLQMDGASAAGRKRPIE